MHIRRRILMALLAASLLLPSCNAYRAFFPKVAFDTEPPELPDQIAHPAILLVTKTNGFRHDEGIEAGVAFFEQLAEQRGWSLFHTENAAVHNADQLARFDSVVWHQTSGDILNDDQKEALKAWLESGGGFVGIHGAGGDSEYIWEWYVEELLGAQFIGHILGPQFQEATVRVETKSHPATAALPDSFLHVEEWYSFDRSVRNRAGFEVLASVDEASYDPTLNFLWLSTDLAMGDHPVVWSRCIGRGRALFSALGHQTAAYSHPEHLRLLEGSLAWTLGVEGEGCRASD